MQLFILSYFLLGPVSPKVCYFSTPLVVFDKHMHFLLFARYGCYTKFTHFILWYKLQ